MSRRPLHPARPARDGGPAGETVGPGEPAPELVTCPFCQAADTELLSPFGSQLLTSQRRCRACRSYFEALREDRPDAEGRGGPPP